MDQLLETWRALNLRRRVILVGAGLLSLVAMISLAQIASRPGMALLYSGLDPATAGEVIGALEQMNITSEVRGDAIYVAEDARDRVRLSLAREGLPRQGQAGYELLDQISGFSATSDMFDAAFWRAKEGELARTILAAPGVRGARVHIAVPSRRPFARSNAEVTASVTVTMSGGALGQAQAKSIRYMVALAVSGLEPEQVAVIDSRQGIVLAPGLNGSVQDADTAAVEREVKLRADIEQLIAARVGRDRARVSVTVETDREAETVVEKFIQPDSRVTVHSDSEEISDSSTGQNGAVTVASNLPDGDAANGGERKSARSETREKVNYDYSETRRERIRQAGAIRRISVAVLVDGLVAEDANGTPQWQPRPAEELAALRDLVKAAIGFDEERGDIVTVDSMAFQPDATPGELVELSPISRFLERNAITLIQIGALALVSLILALTVLRPLLMRRAVDADSLLALPEAEGEAIELGQAGVGTSANGGPSSALPGPDGGAEAVPPTPERLRLAVAENRDQSLATLRYWLGDEEEEAA